MDELRFYIKMQDTSGYFRIKLKKDDTLKAVVATRTNKLGLCYIVNSETVVLSTSAFLMDNAIKELVKIDLVINPIPPKVKMPIMILSKYSSDK